MRRWIIRRKGRLVPGLIVHEWIEEHGGAERVVDAMAKGYPKADIACLWNDSPTRYSTRSVAESWLAKSPLRERKSLALPMMPFVWRGLDISGYEWLLISSHLFAHHAARAAVKHRIPAYVYVHTPARYIWEPGLDARGQRLLVRSVTPLFKRLDRLAASSGAQFAANSHFVKERVKRAWGQDAVVIYPPVGVTRLQRQAEWVDVLGAGDLHILEELPREFILGASRFVKYKNLQQVIEVGEACDIPVVLAGAGPALGELQERASTATVPVHFVLNPSDELLYTLYQRALIFVFPPIEDFGIMPVEAMALGTPVLVNSVGGAAESTKLLQGGVHLNTSTAREINDGVHSALGLDMKIAQEKASLLSEEAFIGNVHSWVGPVGGSKG